MKTTRRRRPPRPIEDLPYFQMVGRIITAAGARAAAADPDALAYLLELHQLLNDAVAIAVAGLRSSGHTWETIGAATGTTRQAALMKWSSSTRSTP